MLREKHDLAGVIRVVLGETVEHQVEGTTGSERRFALGAD